MLAHGVTLFALSIAGIVRAGNTTCKTTSLDWFTQSVGETPCRVYERLRQNCSPGYQVPSMGASPPGDVCNDQVSTCCCNSVAFSLLMMCMNCQYGIGSSINGDTGFDAAAGTYDLYLGRCGPSTNGSLPNITQEAACKQNLNIPKFMYQPFWGDGAWFYEYTKGTAQLQISSGNNDTGLCPKSTASASVTPSSTAGAGGSTASASALPSQSSTNVGAIAGGVVGGVVLLALATLAGFFVARRRKQRGIVDLTEETKTPEATFEPFQMPPGGSTHNSTSNLHLHDYELTGLMHAVAPAPYAAPSSSGWTSTYASSSAPTSTSPPSRSKPGLIATGPPTRAEIYGSQPQFSPPGTMSHSSGPDRHEDSEELSTAYGLGRSASGRLPPSYRPR